MLHENIYATSTSEREDRDVEKIVIETASLSANVPGRIAGIAINEAVKFNPNSIPETKEGEKTVGDALRDLGGVALAFLSVSNPAEAAVREYVDRELSDEERAARARQRKDYELAA